MNTLLQKKSLLALCLSGFFFHTNAQIPFNFSDSLDVNNIKAWQLVHGDMWYDPATNSPKCEYPKGSGKHIGFSGALWFAGYDSNSFLGVSAQTFRSDGVDFWPGPLENSSVINYAESEKWARIWKLNPTLVLVCNEDPLTRRLQRPTKRVAYFAPHKTTIILASWPVTDITSQINMQHTF